MPRKNPTAPDVLGDDRLVTPEVAAHALGVGPSTVYNLVNRGELPEYRIGAGGLRLRVGDLRAYVRAHQEPPRGSAKRAAVV